MLTVNLKAFSNLTATKMIIGKQNFTKSLFKELNFTTEITVFTHVYLPFKIPVSAL